MSEAITADGGAFMDHDADARPPSLFWTLMEGRAVLELGSFYYLRLLMRYLPKGDGHPVVVLPGFVASDMSTRPLRAVLKDLGYPAFGWGLGRNLRFNDERERQMRALLDRVYEERKRKVTIIGWSLGGVFARELAKFSPEKVRSVISLGSPITPHRNYSNAKRLYDAINGAPETHRAAQLSKLGHAPPVPTTSIFSKSDGVVAWQGSLQRREHGHDRVENIEVPASHFGLGVNPLVIYAIADRLAQGEDNWKPFDVDGMRRLVFRAH
jgi:pimeloyl-ACP methyl ester carboxylesterase